jgi:branched-chain amino acid transport system permease protein
MMAALAGILIAPTITLNHILLTLLVINGYAAAMLGKLRSLPATFVGALALGLAQAYVIGFGGNISIGSFRLISAASVIPTVFLFVILVFLPQVRLPAGRLIAAAAPNVPGARSSLVRAAGFIALMVVLSFVLSEFWLSIFSASLVIGVIVLSLVVLSGFAGQISLMQMTFVGLGALVAGRVIASGSILSIVVAGAVAAVAGALVALPALRLQELYLALTTLAVALGVQPELGVQPGRQPHRQAAPPPRRRLPQRAGPAHPDDGRVHALRARRARHPAWPVRPSPGGAA